MKVSWITPQLGTAAARDLVGNSSFAVVDVRDLVDKAGNGVEAINSKISQTLDLLKRGNLTVICCDHGMSRSNAIAAGVLSVLDSISFEEALVKIHAIVGHLEIKLEVLNAVRTAIGLDPSVSGTGKTGGLLVTGGSGFIGAAFCRLCKGKFNVVAPSRAQLELDQGSTKLDLIAAQNDVDCILHLANPRVYQSNAALGHSLTMLRNVLEVCLSRKLYLVYLSSWEVYSGYVGYLHVDEGTPLLPCGPYGESKFLAEALIDHYSRSAGLKCSILRVSPVYGRGATSPKFIYNFIEKARNSSPIVTHRYRNGYPALDLLSVDDLVPALVAAIRRKYVGSLNLGTGRLISTTDVANLVKRELGSGSEIHHLEIQANFACISMNFSRAEVELGWRPTVSIESGLKGLLDDKNLG